MLYFPHQFIYDIDVGPTDSQDSFNWRPIRHTSKCDTVCQSRSLGGHQTKNHNSPGNI